MVQTFEKSESLDLQELLNIVFIQNTIKRVSNIKSFRGGTDQILKLINYRWIF